MTKAEMIDMMEKIREAANSHSCNMCPTVKLKNLLMQYLNR